MLEDKDKIGNDDDVQDEDEDEYEYEYKIAGSGGGMTCLSFEDSAMDAQAWIMVFRETKAPRNFSYNYEFFNSVYGKAKWEAAAIQQSLLFYASHSLLSVDIIRMKGS